MYPGVHVLILIEAIIGLGYLPDNIRSEKPVINPHEFAKVRWIGVFVCDRRQCHIMPVLRFWIDVRAGPLWSARNLVSRARLSGSVVAWSGASLGSSSIVLGTGVVGTTIIVV